MSALAPSGRLDGPLARAFALLAHAGDRAGVGAGKARRSVRPIDRTHDLLVLLDTVDRAAWSVAALRAAFEAGLARAIAEPGSAEAVAARLGLPRALVETLMEALVAHGLAVRLDDGAFALAPALRGEPGLLARFEAALQAPCLQADDFRRQLHQGALALQGWQHVDPAVIDAQGALTALFAQAALPKLALLPGLVSSLRRPGARLLDVGAGAAALSITLCRAFPQLEAVALEPAPAPAAIAEARIAEAGLTGRIALRPTRIEHYDAPGPFDLVFLPQMFLPDDVLPAALRRAARALKPGGWLLAALLRPGASAADASLARLKGLLWGANEREPHAVRAAIAGAGFRPVIQARGRESVGMICAQRPRRGARLQGEPT